MQAQLLPSIDLIELQLVHWDEECTHHGSVSQMHVSLDGFRVNGPSETRSGEGYEIIYEALGDLLLTNRGFEPREQLNNDKLKRTDIEGSRKLHTLKN